MSMERTPPPVLQPTLPAAPLCIEPSSCLICSETMNEGEDSLIIEECSHIFHRICIEGHLSGSSECPICKRACQLSELRKLSIVPKSAPPSRPFHNKGRGRGAVSKQYNTRSTTRNLFSEQQQNWQNLSLGAQSGQTPERNAILSQHNIVANSIDYSEINRMIETNMNRILQNFTLIPTVASGTNNNPPPNVNNNIDMINNLGNENRPQTQPSQGLVNGSRTFSPNLFSNISNNSMPSDKITSIIQSWNLKFDGSSTGLSVEEFLYRIRSLTRDNFNDDFSVICRNLNVLLSGKARDWYWRYHKQVPVIVWSEFCDAIRCQYKDSKSSYDIKEEIRNRKQKPNETFDSFFECVSNIIDRLQSPMSETELIEILQRNLRPDVRQDLLYMTVGSIAELRKLVQRRENFLNDEHVRKNLCIRNATPFLPRRHMAEINTHETDDDSNPDNKKNFIEALQKTELSSKCWNCDVPGHFWQDCTQVRTVFCYGCGIKNIYKPNCVNCNCKKQNISKNLRPMGPQ